MAKSTRKIRKLSTKSIVLAHPKVKKFMKSKSHTPRQKNHVVNALIAVAKANPTTARRACGDNN
jgi:hypothetical protein